MLRLTSEQRRALSVTVRDLANYGAAALVFGQFVGDVTVSWWRFFAAVMLWSTLVAAALFVERE